MRRLFVLSVCIGIAAFLYAIAISESAQRVGIQLVSLNDADELSNGHSSALSVSADGRFVLFTSAATNLVADDTNGFEDLFVRDLVSGTTTRVSVGSSGEQALGPSIRGALSGDGRYLAFESLAPNLVPNDTNALQDVFVKDLQSGLVERVSLKVNGQQATDGSSRLPDISDDGAISRSFPVQILIRLASAGRTSSPSTELQKS